MTKYLHYSPGARSVSLIVPEHAEWSVRVHVSQHSL